MIMIEVRHRKLEDIGRACCNIVATNFAGDGADFVTVEEMASMIARLVLYLFASSIRFCSEEPFGDS